MPCTVSRGGRRRRSRGSIPVRAIVPDAVGVNVQRMVVNPVTAVLGDSLLPLLDLGVEELFHVPALHAHEMVVMPAPVELEHRLSGLEVVADEEPRLLEL